MRLLKAPRVTAPLAALLLLVSAWLGHTLEYVRVYGAAGLRLELLGSVHSYMLPVAVVLCFLAFAAASRFYGIWRSLDARLTRAEASLRAAFRGIETSRAEALESPAKARAGSLVILLLPVQLGLYLLQENLEAIHAGLAAPGLAPLTGRHWAASLVHLAVLSALAMGFALATRRLRAQASAVEVIERLVRFIQARRARREALAPRRESVWLPLPHQLFGQYLWGRPPPAIPQAT